MDCITTQDIEKHEQVVYNYGTILCSEKEITKGGNLIRKWKVSKKMHFSKLGHLWTTNCKISGNKTFQARVVPSK